ncbi:MAG: hypothetical protein C0404_05660 [Verrucomicrobia bacterium]|nr:hypothetical protein [Verrucomicrobiota bacterium]
MFKKLAAVWRWVSPVARVTIGVVLLYWLFRMTDRDEIREIISRAVSRGWWMGAGLACTFLGIAACVVRWKYVLKVQNIHFSNWQVFHITFVGQFFNAFMLGACGGDVIRAYYTVRNSASRRTEAAATIFIDRGVGLFTMILFCCVMIPFRITMFLDNDGPRYAGVMMLIFMVISLLGIVILFEKNIFEHFALFRRIEAMPKIGALLRRSYDAFFLYRGHRGVLGMAMALTLVNLGMATMACYCFGQTLSIDLPFIDYLVLFPIINVLSAVPLTPGSLGVREGLFVSLFGAAFVPPLQAIFLSLMVYAGGAVWSLFGGVLYVISSFQRDGITRAAAAGWLDQPEDPPAQK